MPSFKDKQGRDWELKIDAPTILKIREGCDPNFLLKDKWETGENTVARLEEDPAILCVTIYLLCAKQREERSVSEEAFYNEVLGEGQTISEATEALTKAIANFIQRDAGELLRAMSDKGNLLRKKATELTLTRINDPNLVDNLLARLERDMDAKMATLTPPERATDSPGSSESTPKD